MSEPSIFNALSFNHPRNVILSNTNMEYMVRWSHHIEDRMLTERSGSLLIGAQYLSNIVERMAFYEVLATRHRVVLYALPDVEVLMPSMVEFVPLEEGSRLIQEWFVVGQTLTYQRALIARERTGSADSERCFESLLMHDPQQINTMASQLLMDTLVVDA